MLLKLFGRYSTKKIVQKILKSIEKEHTFIRVVSWDDLNKFLAYYVNGIQTFLYLAMATHDSYCIPQHANRLQHFIQVCSCYSHK